MRFQSTLPAREATKNLFHNTYLLKISIHASREGSDRRLQALNMIDAKFQSTLPAREAT